MNPVNPKNLRKAAHDLKMPFAIALNDSEILTCTKLLRLLPGKRLVCKASLRSGPVIAKIFVDPVHAPRHFKRESDGLNALHAADIPAPQIIEKTVLSNGAIVLVTEFVQNADVLSALLKTTVDEKIRKDILQKIFELIARFHNAGLAQNDLHLDNFLVKDHVLYAIDAANLKKTAAPLPSAHAIENLQLFFAQFDSDSYPLLLNALNAYNRINPALSISQEMLLVGAAEKRRRMWNKLAKKIFRNCTDIVARRTFCRLMLCKREHYTDQFADFLNDPDSAIQKSTLIKKGNSSTVALIDIAARKFVVKRYNIKNPIKLLRRQFPPSRAQRNWLYAHLLGFNNISTPKPIAMLEKRLGPLRSTCYLVTEYLDAHSVSHALRLAKDDPQAQRQILMRFTQTLKKLAEHNISHGDFKATNFVDTLPETSIIDLDAMNLHRWKFTFRKAHRKDRANFLENFPSGTALHDLAKSFLDSL